MRAQTFFDILCMMTKRTFRGINAPYLRSFIFGVEDSLVSTVGLLSGVALASVPRETILLTGVVLIFVEAFSMAAGIFLTESSVEDYMRQRDVTSKMPFNVGVVMFLSYFISGFIPLGPYVFLPVATAFPLSVALSILALFVLGAWGAGMSKISVMKNAFRMAVIGGAAIVVGILAGRLVA